MKGLIAPRQGKGLFIRELTREEFLDMFGANEVIEPYLARRAALRATGEHIDQIQAAIDRGRRAAIDFDLYGALRSGRDFHHWVGTAAANESLRKFVVGNEEKADLYLLSLGNRELISTEHMAASNQEHQEILDAIRSRDPEAAARCVIFHAQSLRARWAPLFRSEGLPETAPELQAVATNRAIPIQEEGTVAQETTFDTAQIMIDFTQMKSFGQDPLILEEGKGIRVTDVFGKSYIDGLSGVFTVNFGHGVDELVDVAAEQGRKISFTAPTMATNPAALRLADLLIKITPEQYSTVKFLRGGSEATEAAIKMARQYQLQAGRGTKFKIISRYMGYHGGTGNAMAASGQIEWKWRYAPEPTGFIHVQPPARPGCVACARFDHCTRACIDLMEDAIVREGPETVAAIIAEPVMMSAGVHVPPDDYFPRLREMCDKHNVVLIFDEIITGFGRTGTLFAAEQFGVWPDIICFRQGHQRRLCAALRHPDR